jgi:hypothetical protein
MKSRLYILIIAFAALFVPQGCEESEFLNTRPLNAITAEDIFSDPALARANLLTIYGGLPKVFGRGTGCYPLDFSASDLNNTFPNSDCRNLRNNDYDASNISSNLNYFWRGNFSFIYQTNIFIEGIEGSEFDEEVKKSFLAEARALRAVFYFELYRFYGGVPIITTPISLTDDTGYNLMRSTRDELADFIINEFTESAENLPVKRTGTDLGRMEKGAALGMKARILLYQASLKNDASLFQQAALTAKSVIDLNRYSLYPDYDKLFLAKSFSSPANNEYILYLTMDLAGDRMDGVHGALIMLR